MEKKSRKIIRTILIILLAFNLICDFVFGIRSFGLISYFDASYEQNGGLAGEWARAVTDNQIAVTVWLVHNNFFAQAVCLVISFLNLFYSIACLRSVYKEKASASKPIVGHWIYAIISLGAVVSSCAVLWANLTIFM